MAKQVVPLQSMETPPGAGSWQKLWPVKRSPRRSRFSGRNCGHGGPMLEQSGPEELNLMESSHTGAVHEGLSPVGGTHAGAGGQCGGRSGRKELLWTDCSPIPCPPAPLEGRRSKLRMKE